MKHRTKEEISALILEAIVNTHRPTQKKHEVYNQFNQLQTNNILKTTTSTNLQTIEPTQLSNQQSSIYLATITRTNNRWKCEKCLIPFANLKLLKLHKAQNHSY